MMTLGRRLLAEAIGTFILVYFGCAAIIANAYPGAGFGLLGIAFAHAIALSIAVTATMNISGGLVNPALTVGMMAIRRLTLRDGIAYIIAQVVGALVAGLCLKLTYPEGVARVVAWGAPQLNINVSFWQGVFIEALITFFLMSAVLATAVWKGAAKVGGFGIGLTLFFLIIAAGPLTGAMANPARALGPAVIAGMWQAHLVWWIGPIVGAVIAAFVWQYLALSTETETAS